MEQWDKYDIQHDDRGGRLGWRKTDKPRKFTIVNVVFVLIIAMFIAAAFFSDNLADVMNRLFFN